MCEGGPLCRRGGPSLYAFGVGSFRELDGLCVHKLQMARPSCRYGISCPPRLAAGTGFEPVRLLINSQVPYLLGYPAMFLLGYE